VLVFTIDKERTDVLSAMNPPLDEGVVKAWRQGGARWLFGIFGHETRAMRTVASEHELLGLYSEILHIYGRSGSPVEHAPFVDSDLKERIVEHVRLLILASTLPTGAARSEHSNSTRH
jgi:hypothetical protein